MPNHWSSMTVPYFGYFLHYYFGEPYHFCFCNNTDVHHWVGRCFSENNSSSATKRNPVSNNSKYILIWTVKVKRVRSNCLSPHWAEKGITLFSFPLSAQCLTLQNLQVATRYSSGVGILPPWPWDRLTANNDLLFSVAQRGHATAVSSSLKSDRGLSTFTNTNTHFVIEINIKGM